jgi:SAM-dependent methyltransferase
VGQPAALGPISDHWGYDRGLPVDRVYIEAFLARHAGDVKGAVLEVQDSRLIDRFGGGAVRRREVLDIDATNPSATILGDLCDPATLPGEAFDCFILTETLQFADDLDGAVRNAYAALRPGGVLLVTVPALSRIAPLPQSTTRGASPPTG